MVVGGQSHVARRARRAGPHDDLADPAEREDPRPRRQDHVPGLGGPAAARATSMPLFAALETPRPRRTSPARSARAPRHLGAAPADPGRRQRREHRPRVARGHLDAHQQRRRRMIRRRPPEEDKPDDGKDESGGTGTAMALDEGKMGKKDSDRAEGQYKMQKNAGGPAARAPAGDRAGAQRRLSSARRR